MISLLRRSLSRFLPLRSLAARALVLLSAPLSAIVALPRSAAAVASSSIAELDDAVECLTPSVHQFGQDRFLTLVPLLCPQIRPFAHSFARSAEPSSPLLSLDRHGVKIQTALQVL